MTIEVRVFDIGGMLKSAARASGRGRVWGSCSCDERVLRGAAMSGGLYASRASMEGPGMTFELSAPHRLELADARARLHALGDYLAGKYGLTINWTSEDEASISGSYLVVTIQGTLRLTPTVVTFSGKDPGMLWRGKAKDYLQRKLDKYLNPSTPLEALPRK